VWVREGAVRIVVVSVLTFLSRGTAEIYPTADIAET
jgi:hypothetical protein